MLHSRTRPRHKVASRRFKSGDLKPLHLNLVKLDREFHNLKDLDAVQEDTEEGVEKHGKKKNVRYGKKGQYEYQYHHDRSGKQHQHLQPRHASKATRVDKVVTSVLYTNPTEPEEIVKTTDDHAPVQKPNYPDHVSKRCNPELQY